MRMTHIVLIFLAIIMKFQSASSMKYLVSGVVIAVSRFTLEHMESGHKNALASRVVSFYHGFIEVGIPCVIQSISNPEQLKKLSQSYSHVIALEWPGAYIHPLCNQETGEALLSFNVTAMHTIESAFKIKTSHMIWTEEKPWLDVICTGERFREHSDMEGFSLAIEWYDMVLVGLEHQVIPFRNAMRDMYEHHRVHCKFLKLTSVLYSPVPVELSFWQPDSKPLDHLRIFFDWDDRGVIAKTQVAKAILGAIEILRSRKDLPYQKGVQVISTVSLPEELKNYTTVEILSRAVNGLINHKLFIDIISSCHIYATAIKSSYENPVVESQMGGAMLVSEPNNVHEELYDPDLVVLETGSSNLAEKIFSKFSKIESASTQAMKIHKWTMNHHSPRATICILLRSLLHSSCTSNNIDHNKDPIAFVNNSHVALSSLC